MRTITVRELKKLLSGGTPIQLIDVRSWEEFEEVHVPDARNIPLHVLDPDERRATGELKADEPVYLLCRSGKRAVTAAGELLAAGFDEPVVVTGGTLAWLELEA